MIVFRMGGSVSNWTVKVTLELSESIFLRLIALSVSFGDED